MIDLCESCTRWDICYLDRYVHRNDECDTYIGKPENQTRSAIKRAHSSHNSEPVGAIKGGLSSIQVRQTLKDRLIRLKRPGESFEDVIDRHIPPDQGQSSP